MAGYFVPEIRNDLPSVRTHIGNPAAKDHVGTFDFGAEGTAASMAKYKGLGEGAKIPADLMQKIEQMGQAFIAAVNTKGDILKTREFADLKLEGPDGRPDPKRVGALLFAASATSFGANGKMTLRFDNELTFTELGKLAHDPDQRKAIADVGRNVERGLLSSRDPLSVQLEQQVPSNPNIQHAPEAGFTPRCPSLPNANAAVAKCGIHQ